MNDLWLTTGLVLGFAALGYIIALYWKKTQYPLPAYFVQKAIGVFLWLLIFAMGYSLGSNEELVRQIGNIGLTAAVLGIFAAGGSVLASFLVFPRGFRKKDQSMETTKTNREVRTPNTTQPGLWQLIKDPAILVSALVIGIFIGIIMPNIPGLSDGISQIFLYILLFFSGAGMAIENSDGLKRMFSGRTLVLPLVTVIGSLIGGLAAALVLGLSLSQGLAGAAGFGWYSLSGVLISDLGDPFLGSAAFLGNLLRESLAIIFIPFLGKIGLHPSAISIAGATSMDVTLPMISRYTGYENMGTAMAHGVILSILVPIIIPLLMAV